MKRRRFLSTFFLVLFFTSPSSAHQPSPHPAEEGLQDQVSHGLELYQQGRSEEARSLLLNLLPALREVNRPDLVGDALHILSHVEIALGYYSAALDHSLSAAEIRAVLHDTTGRARSLNGAGLSYLYLGNYLMALEYYEKALDLDQRNDDVEGQIIRLNNIGNVYFFQGRYSDAFQSYDRALKLAEEHLTESWGLHELQRCLANLAVLYQKLGQYERALNLYSRIGDLGREFSAREQAQMLSNRGVLYRQLGDPYLALDHYQKALELFQEERLLDAELNTTKNIGILVALDLQDLERARQVFADLLSEAQRISHRRHQIHAHLYLGETLRRSAKAEEARRHFQETISAAAEFGLPEEEWKAGFGLGRIYEQQGELALARRAYQRAVEVIESARAQLTTGSLREGFLANKRQVYDALIRTLIKELETRPGDSAALLAVIFQTMEKARARSFIDQFAQNIQARRVEIDPEAAYRLREITTRVSRIWSRRLEASDAEREELKAELAQLETEFLSIEQDLQERMSLPPLQEVSLERVQDGIAAATTLIELWQDEESIAALTLTSDTADLFEVTFAPDSLKQCINQLANPEKAGVSATSCKKLNQAFQDVLNAASFQSRNLVVVPDGQLTGVPFEALLMADGDYLVEKLSVSYLPSAATLPTISGAEPLEDRVRFPWEQSLLAFVASGTAQISEAGPAYPPLPFASKELELVASQITGKKTIFQDQALNHGLVLDQLRSPPPLVHFAAHATVDPVDPEISRIYLGPGPAREEELNFLFLGDVMMLDLSAAHLVTLSACQTGVGKVVSGEGVIDFGRAFLSTGARNVIATLWRVSDQASYQLMRDFYHELNRGKTPAEALRSAKIQFIESGTVLAHPYYWAGYVVTGPSDQSIPLPMSWTVFLLLAGLAIAVLTAGLIIIRA